MLERDPQETPAVSGQIESAGTSRRRFLQWSAVAGAVGATTTLGATSALADPAPQSRGHAGHAGHAGSTDLQFDPLRPPAVPLAVRSPYLSTWLQTSSLPGTWPTVWFGAITAMAGLARIDGTTYVFMGRPALPNSAPLPTMRQTAFELTSTSSRFTLEQDGVELTVTFLSPVEPGDLRRQSIPLSYVTLSARSTDRKAHDVSLYMDISGEWALPDHPDNPITWKKQAITGNGQQLTNLNYQLVNQNPLNAGTPDDDARWGTMVWSTPALPGVTSQIGQDSLVRSAFASKGVLDGSVDPDQPRNIGDRYPVFSHSIALGAVTKATTPFVLSIGHVHTPSIAYLGTPLQPLWTSYFPSWQDMISFFHTDASAAVSRGAALDTKISRDAQRAAGSQYAAICALSLRQAYAGTELVVGSDGKPWAFLKEISSDGNVSTIDVTYPAMPVWSYLDPAYLGLLLAPIFDYVENHHYPKPFAPHDLGSHYPDASGHLDGTGEEDMPVEESANMLIMSAAYLRDVGSAAAAGFARQHYAILKQWADYLVDNALDPAFQNQTDDFTGFIAHSVNLALKGIIGIGAMSKVAAAAGNTADAQRYLSTAQRYIAQWQQKAQDPTAAHLMLAYGDTGSWSLKYNGFADKLLRLGLVPASVAAQEAAWYLSRANTYGVPLDVRDTQTKGDWEMWTAAWLIDHPAARDALITGLYQFADTTPSRVPFTDLYDTVTNTQRGFQARPVVGGMFALLAL